MGFSEQELSRYKRQMMMDGWGEKTQEKLKNSTVFVAGAGGLGSPVSIYLAVAGIGHIRICDFDSPDWSNLNRQILHDHTRIGINKAESAKMTLNKLNPDIEVTAFIDKITADNVDELVGNSVIIVDCMDNFNTRYVLNECAIRKQIPLVYGSIWGMDGRLSFIHYPETPCLMCLFPDPPPQETFPVLGTTPGVIGSLQALEAVKFLTGVGKPLKGKLLVWDGAACEFRTFKIRKDPNCATCSKL
ncbi:HesA/MoeB/ThiF family protein [Candidatus Magnetomonas plexicatena]|uniref:HesA/MoeB/ThiF family protein n=1 Tax=Candidatus Magnetomonas plexicatena TaxID=2552947 RepID=UPI0010FFCFC6|nr:HesA/MoeB/ThiF family protein [Nitrospirales bacterium LBB_01]